MRPNSLEARDTHSVIHGLTNLKRHMQRGPLVIDHGRGVWVTDVDGKEYLEAMSGLWCISLGYGQQRLVDAAATQMAKLPYYHLTNHKGHAPVIALAEKLLEIAPAPMGRVWFANSGSEAMDCAARMAWYYWHAAGEPARKKFIAHSLAYHGNTIAAASLTGARYAHERFNLPLPGFLHVATPHHYRFAQGGESEQAFTDRLIGELEALILREGPETIAAFFTEPVIAAGGVIVPPPDYFAKLQALLKRHGILLVCDEVVTGFARTGEMFGSTTMGIVPDMLVCAKGLSSAYIPISAVMVSEKIFAAMMRQSDELGVFGLTLTYSGHPVAAAVAREALRIYEEEAMPARVRALEPKFLGGLRALSDHPLVGDVRGRGLLAGVELVADKATHAPFDKALGVGPLCAQLCEERGLILRAIGDTLALCPPLVISEAEIETLLARLRAALDATADAIAPHRGN
ncbi:MAG: aminotransferase class III-fold pyridoxal phosphate-dependent enzyme [Variibacter sp.]|nr:aminotransferase class III-fold pyridoxal phosphate-dependent enzyme [Variibacter sp.]